MTKRPSTPLLTSAESLAVQSSERVPPEDEREHGVWGYRDMAVGGFGESPAHQVAHRADPDAVASRRDSRRAAENRSDEQIKVDILLRARGEGIDTAALHVAVSSGAVELTGSVLRTEDRRQIRTLVEQVPGVRCLDDQSRSRREDWHE